MQIVGIVLVRNEERYVERAVRNGIAFCDRLLLVDNRSDDRTPEILERLAKEQPGKIELHQADHPRLSQQLIRPFAGTATWIFGIDGDEIYDPKGLQRLRGRLEQGEFDRHWVVFGNVLNVKELTSHEATGHLAPPCRSMTKLYNFAAIDDWSGDSVERLHGGTLHFRPGYSEQSRYDYHETCAWETSDFRCLHLCFLRRSSRDPESTPRTNIMDRHAWSAGKLLRHALARLSGKRPTNWKEQKYARGPLVTKPIAPFFPPERKAPDPEPPSHGST